MIPQETIQRIMDATRIEEVVGDFVSLKKRGANHIGCCPFHNEKTPSFYVSPSKGIYKCFGCGKAGDAVSFLKEHEHYSYVEALQWLAKKYNIEIEEKELSPEEKKLQSERDSLFHASEFAQKYFSSLIYEDEMGRAVGLEYFHSRGLNDVVIRRFGLGYCKDEWTDFTDHALRNGYSIEVLEKTGLTIVKEESKQRYDRFRGRVMFPIYSISGRVVGFSGRVLSSEKQAAKYVNSPDSEIYNKSRNLYGLFQARQAISKADKCYLVEGNIDVISMFQSGVENTVASCGTSLTSEQIRLIKRFTQNVTVLYDGDSAGIKAALRAIDLLHTEGMHVRLVLFPDGEDPDSYAQKYGSVRLQEYLASHEDNFIMFRTRVLMDNAKDDPIRRAQIINETARSIALVADTIERGEYIRECAHLLHVDEQTLVRTVSQAIASAHQKTYEKEEKEKAEPSPTPQPEEKQPTTPPAQTSPVPPPEVEKHLIQLLLNYGNEPLVQTFYGANGTTEEKSYTIGQIITAELSSDNIAFSHPLCKSIFEMCTRMLEADGQIDPRQITSSDDTALRTFAITIMTDTYSLCTESWIKKGIFPSQPEDNLLQDVRESLYALKSNYVRQQIEQRRNALLNASPEEQLRLLSEIQAYNKANMELGKARRIVLTSIQS